MSLAMLANLVIMFADSPNRTWYSCAVSLTLIIATVLIACASRKRPPPYQPQLVRANGNTCINPNFPRPKPVENEETRRKEIKSLRRQLNTRDKTTESLRYRIHYAEAEREREHQSALRQLSHRVKEADASVEMRQVYWKEWQKERLRSAELEIALDNLQRGNTYRAITRERDAARRDAQRADVSEKEAQRKLAKALRKAESSKEDVEKARKEAREVELAKAIVEEKNAPLDRDLKQTKEARLNDTEKIKQLESRLQQADQEKQEQLRRADAAEKRAEAAEKAHDDLTAEKTTLQQNTKALQEKVELGVTSEKNREVQSMLENTLKKKEELQTMLEAASKKNEELTATRIGRDHRIEEPDAVQKGLMKRIESLETEKASLMQQVQYLQNKDSDTETIRQQNGLLLETIEEMKRQYHTDMDGVKAGAQALAEQVTALQATNEQLAGNLTQRDQELEDEKKKLKTQQDRLVETQNMRRRLISKEKAATKAADQTQQALEECQKKFDRRTKTANHLAELNAILTKEKDDLKAELEEVYGDEKYDESQDQDEYQPQYTNNPAFTQNDYQSSQYDAFGCDLDTQSTYAPPPHENSPYHLPGLGQPSVSNNIPDLNHTAGLGDFNAISQWNAAHGQQPGNGDTSQPTGQAPTGEELQPDFPGVHEYLNATPEQEKQKYGESTFDWNNVDPSLLQ
ncbi:hypothetical protein PRZ48_002082 [Zasmidium cellare]|uniref:Uncharacterized protein n=1 Tax=Zasmidium cellare TaxID=395010 RepID=A0ABR0F313_ZASCE|nr:hypothetical protein PRZ48_002082 [Zasmidium cellare]